VTAQSTLTIEVALPPDQTEAAIYQAFLDVGFTKVVGGGGVMSGNVAASMWSWGENIAANIAHGPRGSVVHLRSISVWPLLLFDLGKNAKNLAKVDTALRALAPVV
jgi:hypothetical protein